MIEFKTWVNVPADRRVTITLPPTVPVGPAEILVALDGPRTQPGAVGDGPTSDPKLNREWAAFYEMFHELLTTHRGEYVAIHEGRVVGSGADKAAVLLEARRRFGDVPILVHEVTETPRPVRIVTPFRRRPSQES